MYLKSFEKRADILKSRANLQALLKSHLSELRAFARHKRAYNAKKRINLKDDNELLFISSEILAISTILSELYKE